jgi:cell division protein FtsQ
MSTDYTIFENSSPRENVKAKSSKKIEKGLKRLLIIAGIIFAAELIWLFGISPFIPFSTVDVRSFSGLEKEEVLRLAGINESSSFISTNVRQAQEKLSSHLLVESALVSKRFPDKISIFLIPRQAAAVTLVSIDSRQVPLYVDRQGVFFKIGEEDSAQTAALPVLSGIEYPYLNMRLPPSLVSLVRSISAIAESSPELLAAISEIRIERKPWEGYDLVLFPVHSSIKVRIENNLSEEILKYTLLMLNVFEFSSPKPEEIDFRSGMGSYKIKEQSL